MAKISLALSNSLLSSFSVESALTGGLLYIFSGPEPVTADEALDMSSTHTQLVEISVNSSGMGLTFDPVLPAALPKSSSEVWSGVVTFDGAQSGEASLPATFYRFCSPGDDGRGPGTSSTMRIQGTAGGPAAGGEMDVGAALLTPNGNNQVVLNNGSIRMPTA